MTTTAEKWPDDKLEAVMIADAERSYDPDVLCHVKALLARIRTLERELAMTIEEIDRLVRLVDAAAVMERKILHGCTDANCKKCDNASPPLPRGRSSTARPKEQRR